MYQGRALLDGKSLKREPKQEDQRRPPSRMPSDDDSTEGNVHKEKVGFPSSLGLSRSEEADGSDSVIDTDNEVGTFLVTRESTLQPISVRRHPEDKSQLFPGNDDGFGQKWSTVKVSQELKDLGTKARARLEEEKMKRPEIQRLEQIPMADPLASARKNKSAFSRKIAARSAAAAPSNRKRKVLPSPASRARASTSWVPDVSHIKLPEREDQSSTVRLHGLPADCTIELVKTFFTGLTPDSVSILLPNHTHIDQLDAMDRSPTAVFETLESHRVRVIADFRSAAAAVLASERSGETIRMPSSNTQDEHNYVVVVTVVDKKMAAALASLRVLAVPRTAFDVTLDDVVTKKLHPMVPAILWSMAARISGNLLPVDRDTRKLFVLLSKKDEEKLWDNPTATPWGSDPAYRLCVDYYNRLVDIQDELLHHVPFPMLEITPLGPSLDMDPGVHLTTAACKALATEMDRIEALLYRVRTLKKLKTTIVI